MNETEKNRENFRQRCAVLQDENASERFTVPMEKTATKKLGNKKNYFMASSSKTLSG